MTLDTDWMADSRTHSGAAEIHPFVEDARDVASENRSGRDQATGGNSGHFQTFHDVLALLEGLCIRVSRISNAGDLGCCIRLHSFAKPVGVAICMTPAVLGSVAWR